MLRTLQLTKRYGTRTALDGLNLHLPRGQFVALLGPNGAGKSTLFQLLTGLFVADEGTVSVAGFSMATQATQALRQIGVVFQQQALDLDLSVQRNLQFHADLHGLPRAMALARISEGLARLGLGAELQRPVRELSGGNRRKVELVRALLHRPGLLLMDEATVGLDPQSRRDLLAAVHAEVRERQATVLWATHWVEEAQQADRVLVLHHGRLLADGTPSDVTAALGQPSLEAGFIAATAPPGTSQPRQQHQQGDRMTPTRRLPLGLTLLAALCGAGTAHAAPSAWITSEKDNTIAVVDLASMKVQSTLPTCKRPRHMQVMPGGKQMVVVCSDSGQADLIDIATQQSTGRVALGDDPEILDVSPDGKTFYVSAEDDATLNFVSSGAGKILREVKVGKEPEGVKATPDGKTVYVTSEVASLVHVIDVASGKVTKNIKVGKRPRRFALSPDGNELWVTNELGASVSIIDTRSGSVSATLDFQVKGARKEDITPVGITFTADGKRAFVGLGRSNHVAFIDVPGRKVTDLVLAGKRAWSVALNKAETQLVVVNGLSDDITVVDVAGAKAVKSIPVGRVPHTAVVVE